MLPTYDAVAVAEVLGLGGIMAGRGPDHRPSFRRSGTPARGRQVDSPLVHELREARAPFADDAPTVASAGAMEAAVEDGLPRSALRHVAEWLAAGDAAKAAQLEWSVVPKTTLERRTDRLSVPESERTERIARLAVHARRALGSDEEARAFMTAPHPELNGRTPVEAARTDLAARRAERVLLAIEYGLAL